MLNSITHSDVQLEIDYVNQTNIAHRKKFAQFFTPPAIADVMVTWLLGNDNLQFVLEPAFGLGIFSRLMLKQNHNLQITGFEIDNHIYSFASKYFSNKDNIVIKLQDYMFNDWNNKYDGIICNPPYFKFHDYDNKNILKEIESKLSFQLNGFTNLYTLFLLKSISQLKKNGRAAYIVPSEFLNSDYGKNVKQYLIDSNLLRYVLIIDFKENVFDDVLTTASILLFANDKNSKKIEFININNVDDLITFKDSILKYPNKYNNNSIDISSLDANIKWRSYYQKQNSLRYKQLISFSEFGKVVRGIATGDNDFFVFNKSKANKFKISDKNLLPCITKSSDINQPFFYNENFQKLFQENKNVFLFDGTKKHDENVKNYIIKGEKDKVNEKYLTSKRNPWFSIENRSPSPIWVSVFHRNGIKFIRNYTEVRNLTTFHCIYLNMFSISKVDLLFAYFLSAIAQEIFNDNRREYGNGLKKFEPNDLNNSLILNLNLISLTDENYIINLLKSYEESYSLIKDKKNIYLEKINNAFRDLFIK